MKNKDDKYNYRTTMTPERRHEVFSEINDGIDLSDYVAAIYVDDKDIGWPGKEDGKPKPKIIWY